MSVRILLLLPVFGSLIFTGCATQKMTGPALVTKTYPVSADAAGILQRDMRDTHIFIEPQDDEGRKLFAVLGFHGGYCRQVRPSIWERYGLAPAPGSSFVFDGQKYEITSTEENHRVIRIVLGVIEDTLRLKENDPLHKCVAPFAAGDLKN